MEQFAVDTISAEGALGVLFVLFLLAFGWCYFRIKGYDEFLNTRGCERPSVCRQQLFMRKDNVRFLKWLEKNYERQTA